VAEPLPNQAISFSQSAGAVRCKRVGPDTFGVVYLGLMSRFDRGRAALSCHKGKYPMPPAKAFYRLARKDVSRPCIVGPRESFTHPTVLLGQVQRLKQEIV
jgi:hypothetical protein